MAIAIYARQSVEKENSISCETQIEYCKSCLKPDERKQKILTFVDEGFTGANTNRNGFQNMMRQIERGKISKIYAYKFDRISRSLSDFMKIIEILDEYGTEFSSATEGFDTSTPFGRAMCKILMIFAELERENIIMRVTQAYEDRSEKQLYMGGRRPYGFDLIETTIDSIKTKMLSLKPEEAEQVKYIFDNYAVEGVSLRRLMDNLIANDIHPIDGTWSTSKLSAIIQNPIYVQADNSVYDYYKRNNTNIVSEPSEFDGVHGAQLYGKTKHKKKKDKSADMSDMKLVVMRHEGFVPSSTWLACQKRLEKNKQVGNSLSNTTSWLGGKIVCKSCGRTMTVTKGAERADGERTRYFSCTGKSHNRACKGVKKPLYADTLEDMVYELIAEKLADLKQRRRKISTDNTQKINMLKNELQSIKNEQNNLVKAITSGTAIVESPKVSAEDFIAQAMHKEKYNILLMLKDGDTLKTIFKNRFRREIFLEIDLSGPKALIKKCKYCDIRGEDVITTPYNLTTIYFHYDFEALLKIVNNELEGGFTDVMVSEHNTIVLDRPICGSI